MTGLSVWRVEWLRLVRTRRLLALAGVFVLFGVTGPLLARYRGELVGHLATPGSNVTIIFPPPVPADGITGYTQNALQIGLIVAVVIAASACALDARPALSIFYRTRARTFRQLLLPRAVISAAAAVAGYLAGTLAAWYETAVLIGAPDVGALAEGAVADAVYLVFAVAITALAATLARGPLGTVGIALTVVFGGPLLGQVPALAHWLPSALLDASNALQRHTAEDHHQRALAVTAALIVACVAFAVIRGARRETPQSDNA
ncbi:hypothetical protein [Actinocrispum wychmicini]|uniref:ABC-2 type transport system permease protein n=1 Tax=Actinocrispum wychmicini TaxID=1213861 RepID=A0A4R2JZN8_9PSEU|nr:hypothetical protein [Actinocrispum wychmicini]TCO59595.1 ABC-2 type transport system permease protein [Actinocrispum wychmicini]